MRHVRTLDEARGAKSRFLSQRMDWRKWLVVCQVARPSVGCAAAHFVRSSPLYASHTDYKYFVLEVSNKI